MTLTVELSPELEEALRTTAKRAGLPLDRYVVRVLQDRVVQGPGGADVLPREEAELLQKINEGLPETTWEDYHKLKAKRDADTLSPDEHADLLALVDQVEIWNARRLQFVAELAKLRGVHLRDLVRQLGIASPPDA
jgi:hypothetical protein